MSNSIKQTSALAEIDNKIRALELSLDKAFKERRAIINNNDLNKWPSEKRIDSIGQNGNTGEHY